MRRALNGNEEDAVMMEVVDVIGDSTWNSVN